MSCDRNPRFPRARFSKAGISLVEVMIAVAILLVTSAGVFGSMNRMQRNSIVNRALTNSDNLLRNCVEQAMARGWDNEATPLDILAPTIAGTGSAYNNSTTVTDGTWRLWHMYAGRDALTGETPIVPIYEDVQDTTRNVPGRIYRKVQYVTGTDQLLWITFRVEWFVKGEPFALEAWTTRSVD